MVFLGALTVKGVLRGFFREAFGLAALVAGVAAAAWLGERFADEVVARWIAQPVVARVGAHVVLFLGPYLGLQAVGYVLHKLGRAIFLGGLDRLVGGVFGVLTGALVVGVGLAAAQNAGIGGAWLADSTLANPLAAWSWWLVQQVRENLS